MRLHHSSAPVSQTYLVRRGCHTRRPEMKKYLLAATLAALVASPALAAGYHRAMRDDSAMQAYAFVPQSDAVVDNGKIIGADPDAVIRTQLLREGDHTQQNGGN